MDVCDYQCPDQDPNSILSQFEEHHDEMVSHMPVALLPLASQSPIEKCDHQIVVLDSSRIAMQIATGQIIWPIVPKPKEVTPKLELDAYPYANGNTSNGLQSDLENTSLALGHIDTPLEKCKVRKRLKSATDDSDVHDGDVANEKQAIMRWKDAWVAQLIHIRGRMQASFAGPQKQRIDLWQVIKNEMARTCPGFDKDSEACRKKWRRVYKEYRDEKALHAQGDSSQRCKFYDLLEFYMGDGSDNTNEPPVRLSLPPINEMVPVKCEALENDGCANGQEIYATRRPPKRGKRFDLSKESTVDTESLHALVSELVVLSKEMLQTTRQFEQDKLEVLHSLRETLHEISGKI
ncbi:hypothetical protein KP509_30G014500 [Ceratopteris richardii]|uniref:Myb/SANT-like DNA-binding domain-containing protein n=2 Tax=Ceratopteris richardii TaxID=49495 RepID=A0A8T2R006_CERRI|nr:hypothetical protein KP509_30G014500 [Ceratopteris richardii]